MTKQNTIFVLAIANHKEQRDVYTAIFAFDHYKVDTAATISEALGKLKRGGWDVVLLDLLYSGGLDCISLLETYKRDPAYTQAKKHPLIVAIVDDEEKSEKIRSLVDEMFIMGSFTPGEVLQRVQARLQQRPVAPVSA